MSVKYAHPMPPRCKDPFWWAVLDAFGWRCAWCGVQSTALTRDHWYPRSRDDPDLRGRRQWGQLVPLCTPCNTKKGDHRPAYTHGLDDVTRCRVSETLARLGRVRRLWLDITRPCPVTFNCVQCAQCLPCPCDGKNWRTYARLRAELRGQAHAAV